MRAWVHAVTLMIPFSYVSLFDAHWLAGRRCALRGVLRSAA